MVVLAGSEYVAPLCFRNGHLQTAYPTLFRPIPSTSPQRARLDTADGDFVDIDRHLSATGRHGRLAVISHGLEGNSRKKYVLGMARHLTRTGWDVACLNFRGCSGEPNRLPRFYHSGVTDDLHTVLTWALGQGDYSAAALIGFSMGGNQTLKYLGENPALVPRQVKAAVVFSVPCDLAGASRQLANWQNRLYMRYFMRGLQKKIQDKAQIFPECFDLSGLLAMRTFSLFDDRYTAPLHGFVDGEDYYQRCSANRFLGGIRLPTLLVQAGDDPFLSPTCYPGSQARGSSVFHLEIPRHGGHVGFVGNTSANIYWSEERAGEFLRRVLAGGDGVTGYPADGHSSQPG
ncbi:MAG: YheT family hydrolase [Desulfopila sp.]